VDLIYSPPGFLCLALEAALPGEVSALALRTPPLDALLEAECFHPALHSHASQEAHRHTSAGITRGTASIVLHDATLWIQAYPGVERAVRAFKQVDIPGLVLVPHDVGIILADPQSLQDFGSL
jgi:hypothetical protein